MRTDEYGNRKIGYKEPVNNPATKPTREAAPAPAPVQRPVYNQPSPAQKYNDRWKEFAGTRVFDFTPDYYDKTPEERANLQSNMTWQTKIGGENVPLPKIDYGRAPNIRSYWDLPDRVIRAKDMIDNAPDGWEPPDWLDVDGINTLYGYMEHINQGKPQDQWQRINSADPNIKFLDFLPQPPQDQIPRSERDPEWVAYQGIEQWKRNLESKQKKYEELVTTYNLNAEQARAEQEKLQKESEADFSKLEPVQQLLYSMNSITPMKGQDEAWRTVAAGSAAEKSFWGAMGATGMALGATGLATGAQFGPWGAVAMGAAGLAAGASTYVLAKQGKYNEAMSVLNFFNAPAEFTEKVIGSMDTMPKLERMGIDPSLATSLAWQSGKATYETKAYQVGNWEANIYSKVAQFLNPEWSSGKIAKAGEVWMFEKGLATPQLIKEGFLVGEPLVEMSSRIMAGEDPNLLYEEIVDRYGYSGTRADFIAQSWLDPLNAAPYLINTLSGAIAGDLGNAKWAQAAKNTRGSFWIDLMPEKLQRVVTFGGNIHDRFSSPDKVWGLRSTAGIFDTVAEYKNLLRVNFTPIGTEKVPLESYTKADRFLANLNDEYKFKELEVRVPPRTPIARLFHWLAADTADTSAYKYVDNLDQATQILWDRSGQDPAKYAEMLTKVADSDNMQLATRLAHEFDTPMIRSVSGGVKYAMDQQNFKTFLNRWNSTEWSRNLMVAASKVLPADPTTNASPMTRVFNMLKDGQAVQVFDLIRNTADTDPLIARYKADLTRPDADAIAVRRLKPIVEEWIPYHPDAMHAAINSRMLTHMTDYLQTRYDIKMPTKLERIIAMSKGISSLVLLGINPNFFKANVMNNSVTLASQGLFGFMDTKTVENFWKAYDITPPKRLLEGLGPTGVAQRIYAKNPPSDGLSKVEKAISTATKAGLFGRLSGKFEQIQGSTATTLAMMQYMHHNWKPGVGFDVIPPDLANVIGGAGGNPSLIMGMIASATNSNQLQSILGKQQVPSSMVIGQAVRQAAEQMYPENPDLGMELIDRLHVDELIQRNMELGVADPLMGARDFIDERIEEMRLDDLVLSAENYAARAAVEGVPGIMSIYNDLQHDYREKQMRYRDLVQEYTKEAQDLGGYAGAMLYIDKRFKKIRSQELTNLEYAVALNAIVERIDTTSPAGANLVDMIVRQNEAWTQAEWDKIDIRDKWKMAGEQGDIDWQIKAEQEITEYLAVAYANDNIMQSVINKGWADILGKTPEQRALVETWQNLQEKYRTSVNAKGMKARLDSMATSDRNVQNEIWRVYNEETRRDSRRMQLIDETYSKRYGNLVKEQGGTTEPVEGTRPPVSPPPTTGGSAVTPPPAPGFTKAYPPARSPEAERARVAGTSSTYQRVDPKAQIPYERKSFIIHADPVNGYYDVSGFKSKEYNMAECTFSDGTSVASRYNIDYKGYDTIEEGFGKGKKGGGGTIEESRAMLKKIWGDYFAERPDVLIKLRKESAGLPLFDREITGDIKQGRAGPILQSEIFAELMNEDLANMEAGLRPDTSVTPPPAAPTAGIPFMITRTMRRNLENLGFTKDQIDNMTPSDAWDKLHQTEPVINANPDPEMIDVVFRDIPPEDLDFDEVRLDPPEEPTVVREPEAPYVAEEQAPPPDVPKQPEAPATQLPLNFEMPESTKVLEATFAKKQAAADSVSAQYEAQALRDLPKFTDAIKQRLMTVLNMKDVEADHAITAIWFRALNNQMRTGRSPAEYFAALDDIARVEDAPATDFLSKRIVDFNNDQFYAAKNIAIKKQTKKIIAELTAQIMDADNENLPEWAASIKYMTKEKAIFTLNKISKDPKLLDSQTAASSYQDISRVIKQRIKDTDIVNPDVIRAAIQVREDGKILIRATKASNMKDFMEEMIHLYMYDIDDESGNILAKEVGYANYDSYMRGAQAFYSNPDSVDGRTYRAAAEKIATMALDHLSYKRDIVTGRSKVALAFKYIGNFIKNAIQAITRTATGNKLKPSLEKALGNLILGDEQYRKGSEQTIIRGKPSGMKITFSNGQEFDAVYQYRRIKDLQQRPVLTNENLFTVPDNRSMYEDQYLASFGISKDKMGDVSAIITADGTILWADNKLKLAKDYLNDVNRPKQAAAPDPTMEWYQAITKSIEENADVYGLDPDVTKNRDGLLVLTVDMDTEKLAEYNGMKINAVQGRADTNMVLNGFGGQLYKPTKIKAKNPYYAEVHRRYSDAVKLLGLDDPNLLNGEIERIVNYEMVNHVAGIDAGTMQLIKYASELYSDKANYGMVEKVIRPAIDEYYTAKQRETGDWKKPVDTSPDTMNRLMTKIATELKDGSYLKLQRKSLQNELDAANQALVAQKALIEKIGTSSEKYPAEFAKQQRIEADIEAKAKLMVKYGDPAILERSLTGSELRAAAKRGNYFTWGDKIKEMPFDMWPGKAKEYLDQSFVAFIDELKGISKEYSKVVNNNRGADNTIDNRMRVFRASEFLVKNPGIMEVLSKGNKTPDMVIQSIEAIRKSSPTATTKLHKMIIEAAIKDNDNDYMNWMFNRNHYQKLADKLAYKANEINAWGAKLSEYIKNGTVEEHGGLLGEIRREMKGKLAKAREYVYTDAAQSLRQGEITQLEFDKMVAAYEETVAKGNTITEIRNRVDKFTRIGNIKGYSHTADPGEYDPATGRTDYQALVGGPNAGRPLIVMDDAQRDKLYQLNQRATRKLNDQELAAQRSARLKDRINGSNMVHAWDVEAGRKTNAKDTASVANNRTNRRYYPGKLIDFYREAIDIDVASPLAKLIYLEAGEIDPVFLNKLHAVAQRELYKNQWSSETPPVIRQVLESIDSFEGQSKLSQALLDELTDPKRNLSDEEKVKRARLLDNFLGTNKDDDADPLALKDIINATIEEIAVVSKWRKTYLVDPQDRLQVLTLTALAMRVADDYTWDAKTDPFLAGLRKITRTLKAPKGALYSQGPTFMPGTTPTVLQAGGAMAQMSNAYLDPLMAQIRQNLYGMPQNYDATWYNNLDATNRARFDEYLQSAQENLSKVKAGATNWGLMQRDNAVLNYNNRSNYDTILDLVFPYQFWFTRNALEWSKRLVGKPHIMSEYVRRMEMMKKLGEDVNIPTRLRGKMRVPWAWAEEWMGDSIYYNPWNDLMPVNNLMMPYDRIINEAQNPGEDNTNPLTLASMVMSPNLMITEAYNGLVGKADQPLPITQMGYSMNSLGEAMGDGSLSNFLKAVGTGMTKAETLRQRNNFAYYGEWSKYIVMRELSNMAAEGTDIEQVRLAMIENKGPVFEEATRRVERQIGLKVNGSALAQTLAEGQYGNLGFALVATLFPDGVFPVGEMKQRGLLKQMNSAWKASAAGDPGPISKLFKENPELNARLGINDEPDVMLKKFLLEGIRKKFYEDLQPINKRALSKQLGEKIDRFIKPDLDVKTIELTDLVETARILNLVVPKTDLTANIEKTEIPEYRLFDDNEIKILTDYMQERNERWPNYVWLNSQYNSKPGSREKKIFLAKYPELKEYWDWNKQMKEKYPVIQERSEIYTGKINKGEEIDYNYGVRPEIIEAYNSQVQSLFPNHEWQQSTYFSLPEGAQRKAFVRQYPELADYWSWNEEYKATNPQIAYYSAQKQADYLKYASGVELKPEDMEPAKLIEAINVLEFPSLVRQDLVLHYVTGEDLTPGTTEYLKKLWQKQGTDDEFEYWVENLF